MTQRRRVLHQFPISHYCEKTRWHLERKGLAYSVRNLFPGLHAAVNLRLAGQPSVPVLLDGKRIIGDSTRIALYLEEAYAATPLLPSEPSSRTRVLELEEYFDERLGPAVRRYIYGELLRQRGGASKVFFSWYGKLARATGRVVGVAFEYQLRRMYRIDDAGIDESESVIRAAAGRLQHEIGDDPSRYLVGSTMTLADVTAASLFAPLFTPRGCPWVNFDAPPRVRRLRDELKDGVVERWVTERYRVDRAVRST